MSLVDSIKMAARISTSTLDDEVERLALWAQSELVRVGVPDDVVTDYDNQPLIYQAIITGVISELVRGSDLRASAAESWEYQKDSLRKHKWTS